MGSLGGYLGQLLGHFGVTLGLLRVAWGDFCVILESFWRYDACIWGLGGAVFDLVLAR